MCLTIDRNIHVKRDGNKIPFPFIADEDILVTKMLNPVSKYWLFGRKRAKTPIMGYEVLFDRNGTATLFATFAYDWADKNRYVYVDRGIHAYTGVGEKSYNNICKMMEYNNIEYRAIIPKGTRYYIGDDGDVVAEKMTIFVNSPAYIKYLKNNEIPHRIGEMEE